MNKQPLKWCMGILVIGTALLGGCAAGPVDNGVPALRVTGPTGKSSILLGSVHVGVEGLRQPDMAALFKDARSYVVESVPEEAPSPPSQSLSYGLLDDNGNLVPARWARDLNHREVGLLAERVKCNVSLQGSTSPERFVHVLLAMADPLSVSEIAIRHCVPGGAQSRDAFLALAADERGVPSFGLELQSEVEARRRQVREEIYVQRLKLALAPNNEAAMRQVGSALNEGDYDAITSLTAAGVSPSDHEEYRRVMIDNRNEAWLDRLQVRLLEGNAVINVGAAHLAGENGLIALLRGKGYRVDRVLLQGA